MYIVGLLHRWGLASYFAFMFQTSKNHLISEWKPGTMRNGVVVGEMWKWNYLVLNYDS